MSKYYFNDIAYDLSILNEDGADASTETSNTSSSEDLPKEEKAAKKQIYKDAEVDSMINSGISPIAIKFILLMNRKNAWKIFKDPSANFDASVLADISTKFELLPEQKTSTDTEEKSAKKSDSSIQQPAIVVTNTIIFKNGMPVGNEVKNEGGETQNGGGETQGSEKGGETQGSEKGGVANARRKDLENVVGN